MFKNKEGKVRSGWKIFLGLLATFAIIIGIYIIFGMLGSVFLMTTKQVSQEMLNQKINELLELWFMPLLLLQNIVTIAVPIFIWKVMIKRPLTDMGLGSIKKHGKELGSGLLFGALSITLVFIMLLATGNAEVKSWEPTFSVQTITYLLLFIGVGIGEEVLGRGYIMSVLRQTKNIVLIVIISSVIFSLMHMGNSGFDIIPFTNIFLVGILFAYMYLKSGNIWMPIGYHITWNYFQGNVYGFLVSGQEAKGIISTGYSQNNIINGGDFGPEGGLVVTAVIIIGFIFVKWYYRKKKFNFLEMDLDGEIPMQILQAENEVTATK